MMAKHDRPPSPPPQQPGNGHLDYAQPNKRAKLTFYHNNGTTCTVPSIQLHAIPVSERGIHYDSSLTAFVRRRCPILSGEKEWICRLAQCKEEFDRLEQWEAHVKERHGDDFQFEVRNTVMTTGSLKSAPNTLAKSSPRYLYGPDGPQLSGGPSTSTNSGPASSSFPVTHGKKIPQRVSCSQSDHDLEYKTAQPYSVLSNRPDFGDAAAPCASDAGSVDSIEIVTGEEKADRFAKYGSFSFMSLPGELRNLVYPISIGDAVTEFPEQNRVLWRALPLLQSSSAVRKEALGIYASTQHFYVPFRSLNAWCNLVTPIFLHSLNKLDIAFPRKVNAYRLFDFTNLYRLQCFIAPKANILITSRDRILDSGGRGNNLLVLDTHKLNHLLRYVDRKALSACFEQPYILSNIWVNGKGEIGSMQTSHNLWLTYDDLKRCFDPPKDFRLIVNDIPWQGTSLAMTTAPRTTRETKEIEAEKAKVDEEAKTNPNSWVNIINSEEAKGAWQFLGTEKDKSKEVAEHTPQHPSWFSSYAREMRGTKPEFNEDESD